MRKYLVAITLLFSCINTSFALLNGSGTQASPWLIQSLADFDEFTANPSYWAGYTRLDTNIDLTSKTYSAAPIAPDTDNDSGWDGIAFTGTFNGNSHTISNLTIDGAYYLGLFGKISGGSVTNLGTENVDISGIGGYIGGLCGKIDDSSTKDGSITNCYSTGTVTGGDDYVGGLCGINHCIITSCYSTGTVNGNNCYFGGLCGTNTDSITNCYSTSAVNGDDYVGGLCGANPGNITNCYSTGTVDGDYYVGGLCGENDGIITSCYSTSPVNGDGRVGGLCGTNFASITNCCSTGTVTGNNFYFGGLCGENAGSITNCYSTGTVNGTGNSVGGFCGYNAGSITSCYFLDTAGPDNGLGIHLTDTQMKLQSSFIGWDFLGEATNGVSGFWMIAASQYPSLYYFDPAFTPYSFSGSGTQADPYHVANIYDLSAIWQYPSADYVLDNSIDTSGTVFNTAVVPSFAGTFNGNSHSISNLTIDGGGYLGLFSLICNGSVTNLALENISISGTGNYIGGLCGISSNSITSCYSTGTVTGNDYIGGLCGTNYHGSITSGYSTSMVTGSNYIGGLCGENLYSSIINSYSSGAVTGSSSVGGLCGGSYSGTVSGSFWDIDTSGQPASAGGEGKTTIQMQDINTFLAANWDFVNIWDICNGTNYPRFIWQTIKGDLECPDGVTLVDFAIFSQAWLTSSGQPGYNEDCDLVDDDTINLADLTVFAENFLQGL